MPTYRQRGTVLTDHTFTVPLDHGQPDGEQIELYAREVVAAEKLGHASVDLPWLLYLQGGPGHRAPRPIGRDSWLDRALREYRVLLLDQRGVGRSTPVNRQTLPSRGDAAAQARYLTQFRADSIVADCELIRRQLTGDRPWSVLGQSFGGFCAVNYLSRYPTGLREVFLTGGLPGLDVGADDVYRATYPAVAAKNVDHYCRYPGDVDAVRRIAQVLLNEPATLPDGGVLTVEAFQSLGRLLGSSTGSHRLHYLLEDAFEFGHVDGLHVGVLTDSFLAQVQQHLSFAAAPLYAVLHEACYAQGPTATAWSAERVRSEFPRFDAAAALADDEPVLLTGEMIYPWMFDTDPALAPLRDVAQLLAHRTDWPPLYDAQRLATNTVPVAAVVYHDDMYVDAGFSLRTAASIAGLRPWVTNEYEHDGLHVSDGAVLDRLIGIARGTV